MIVQSRDMQAIAELGKLLISTDKDLLFDVLKTLQMIGAEAPETISHLYPKLSETLDHKVNKVVWMGMCAMSEISHFHAKHTYHLLPKIMETMNAGGAILKDKGFTIMLNLYMDLQYQDDLDILMLEQLTLAPDNQFGQYVEKWTLCIQPRHLAGLIKVVEERITELSDPMHKKRSMKALKRLLKKLNLTELLKT